MDVSWLSRPMGCCAVGTIPCILAIMFLLAGGGCSSLKRRSPFDREMLAARELGRQGVDAMHRDNLPEARKCLVKALGSCPEHLDARYHLAKVLWKQGEAERAIEEMDSAVRGSGGDPAWTVELGRMLLEQNEHSGAIECATRALERSPNLPNAWRLQGDAMQATGDATGALRSYHRAVADGDSIPGVLTQIAELYLQQQRPRRALSTLQRLEDEVAIEDQPDRLALLQGIACGDLGRHDDAMERLLVARSRLGDTSEVLYQLASAQWKSGHIQAASETVKLASHAASSESSHGDVRIERLAAHLTGRANRVAQATYAE